MVSLLSSGRVLVKHPVSTTQEGWLDGKIAILYPEPCLTCCQHNTSLLEFSTCKLLAKTVCPRSHRP